MLSALLSSVASPCLKTEFVLASGLLVVSFSSPPPGHHLTRAGLCHVAIYIYPESALLGTLIECAPLSLSCHTAYSLGVRLDLTDVGLQKMVLCHTYTDLSRNEIPNWSFLHSTAHSTALVDPTSFSSVDLAFL